MKKRAAHRLDDTGAFTPDAYERLSAAAAKSVDPAPRSNVVEWLLVLLGVGFLFAGPILLVTMINTSLPLALLGLVMMLSSAPIGVRAQRREDPQRLIDSEIEKRVLAELGSDPLSWPVWMLGVGHFGLKYRAEGAAKELLYPDLIPALKARKRDGGTIGEHVAALRGTPPPVLTVTAPARAADRTGELTHLRTRHHQLSAEYGEYLTDPARVLIAPALNDVTETPTAEFVEAYADLSALPTDSDDVDLASYRRALERASVSWRTAQAHADRVGLSRMDESERKRVKQARRLLALALDPSATEAERASAYSRVTALLEGLVTLPEQAVAALAPRRSLTATPA